MTSPRIPRVAFLALALLPLSGLAAATTPMHASAASARSAVVRDLRSGLLRTTDLPARSGLSQSRIKVYTNFTREMKEKAGGSCSQSPLLRTGWRQGVIEIFFDPHGTVGGSFSSLMLCAYRFVTSDAAHAGFATIVRTSGPRPKHSKIVSSRIGDEALAFSVSQGSDRLYGGLFRHSNVVESILYLGDTRLSWSQFERLASLVNARLH